MAAYGVVRVVLGGAGVAVPRLRPGDRLGLAGHLARVAESAGAGDVACGGVTRDLVPVGDGDHGVLAGGFGCCPGAVDVAEVVVGQRGLGAGVRSGGWRLSVVTIRNSRIVGGSVTAIAGGYGEHHSSPAEGRRPGQAA